MNQRSLLFVSAFVLASAAALRAQETSGIEDERMQALQARNERDWLGPRNKVSVGFRLLNSGGSVNFRNLGAVPAKEVAAASAGNVTRQYDDGTVYADGLRTDEIDANGNQTSTPGGRYAVYSTQTDGTRAQIGDMVSYTPGQTRTYQSYNQSQIDAKPGYLAFTTYSTTSEGGHLSDKAGPSAGVELNFNRDIGRIGRRFQWGFTAGVALNGINSKTTGSVISTLHSRTDFYAVSPGGTLTVAPATGPTYNNYEVGGVVINPAGLETTVPISQTPDGSLTQNSTVAGGATVNGRWQVRGAYFMVKLGPSLRAQFNDSFSLSASAGFAAAYAGTTYTATETLDLDNIPDGQTAGDQTPQSSTAAKFVSGYYADLTFEWAANETTGLFAGATAQQLSAYEQMVVDRIARVDLGSAVGVRGGVSIKF